MNIIKFLAMLILFTAIGGGIGLLAGSTVGGCVIGGLVGLCAGGWVTRSGGDDNLSITHRENEEET